MVILMLMETKPTLTIFLGEDNDEDAYFFELAVSQTYPDSQVLRYKNGAELILELYRIARGRNTLVFLDLAMPLLDGLQTLGQIRQTPFLSHLPIFILTASTTKCDIEQSYQAGTDGYIVKPNSTVQLSRLIKPAMEYGINLIAD